MLRNGAYVSCAIELYGQLKGAGASAPGETKETACLRTGGRIDCVHGSLEFGIVKLFPLRELAPSREKLGIQ
eukprot:9239125-Pyramimonas_sp.AAC.1